MTRLLDKAQIEGKLTWRELVRREPYLRYLLEAARCQKDDPSKPSYCANYVWYTYFKPQLERYVGWFARVKDGVVNTSEAYDLAYEKIYNALPNCRNCNCL
jgi:predicted transcriptional regulator with HTH domain